MKKSILKLSVLSVLCVLCGSLLSGCAETPAASSSTVAATARSFAWSDAGQALQVALTSVTLDAAAQYIASGTVDPKTLVANTLDGAAENLRSLAGTPQASSPKAISDSVALGANVPGVSKAVPPIVAANVTRQIQSGVVPDQAIENLATLMNLAAAKQRRSKSNHQSTDQSAP